MTERPGVLTRSSVLLLLDKALGLALGPLGLILPEDLVELATETLL